MATEEGIVTKVNSTTAWVTTRKSSACEGIKINSLIPALGYNMIRPPILSQKKRPSKKEHLYLSAFRRIVPDGILVYLESEVINDQRFQKIIDILNEFG